jgi:hypothetical protein
LPVDKGLFTEAIVCNKVKVVSANENRHSINYTMSTEQHTTDDDESMSYEEDTSSIASDPSLPSTGTDDTESQDESESYDEMDEYLQTLFNTLCNRPLTATQRIIPAIILQFLFG